MVPPEDSAPASSAKVKRRLVRTSRRGGCGWGGAGGKADGRALKKK